MSAVSKFTSQTQKTIPDWIRGGCFRYQACAAAGITRKTLRVWEKKAETDPHGEYAEFVSELERAQFAAEARLQVLHYSLATGGKLPDDVVTQLTGELRDMFQRALVPALETQLKFGGSRPWAEVQKFEHAGNNGTAGVREAAQRLRAYISSAAGGLP